MLLPSPLWDVSKVIDLKNQQFKMIQINATTKNCLELQQKSHSTRFHHTGWLQTHDFQWIPFHAFPAEIGW